MKKHFVDYAKLFGDLDFKTGDSSRSVYSPAAYLADLLQILDDYFVSDSTDSSSFDQRRPDIKGVRPDNENNIAGVEGIPLDKENTYTIIPYLDIVNELLEKEVAKKGKPYQDVLKKATYPLNLPFNLPFKKAQHYLEHLAVSPAEIQKAFSKSGAHKFTEPDVQSALLATEYMGWSDEDYASFYKPTTEPDFLKAYQVETVKELEDIELFLGRTGLTERELREIIYQDASKTVKNQLVKNRFVHAGLGGYVYIDEKKNLLKWSEANANIPFAWFEKVDRFIKIKQKSKISYTDLDLILSQHSVAVPFQLFLLTIPMIKSLSEQTNLSIAEVCAFFGQIPTFGLEDEDGPTDLFNQVINKKSSELYKKIISAGANYSLPTKFKGYEVLNTQEDLLLSSSDECRTHLLHALNISEKDFKLLAEKMRERVIPTANQTAFFKQGADLHSLTVLFRLKQLAKMLEGTFADLMVVFDILETDPAIRDNNFFHLFLFPAPKEEDNYYKYKNCYQVLFDGDSSETAWLMQMVLGLSKWLRDQEISINELLFWVKGQEKDEESEKRAKSRKVKFLNNLLTQYQPFFLQSSQFISDRFNQRDAKIILDTLQQPVYNLVSDRDERLVLSQQENIEQAAYDAIIDLEMVNPSDFMGLQIAGKMANKIINNLILQGYVDKELRIIEENFPATVEAFSIDFDFSDFKSEVYSIINQKVTKALIELSDQEIDFDLATVADLAVSVYKSDLQPLGLANREIEILYDNLIFNQYLTEEGAIVAPYIFAFEGEDAEFKININIGTNAGQVYEQLSAYFEDYLSEELVISADIFQETGLSKQEIDDLLENLIFNDYLNEKNKVLDKAAILKLADKDFLLALVFYPKRKQILAALQERVLTFKIQHFALETEIVQKIANEIVANRTFEALRDTYFPDGPVAVDKVAYFLNPQNKLDFFIDDYFSDAATETVFAAIQKIILSANRFIFNDLVLADLEFSEIEMNALREWLYSEGYINDFNGIPQENISYFLNINNALDFSIPEFEDYNKDIFFALNAIAKEINGGVMEIKNQLENIATSQQQALFTLFEEEFGSSADLIELIFQKIYNATDNLGHEILLPILASVAEKEKVVNEVQDTFFKAAYQRMCQLVSVFNKFELGVSEAKVILTDQDIAQKFPEKLTLPKHTSQFDAILETDDDHLLVFIGHSYYQYSAIDFSLQTGPENLSKLSPVLAEISAVDAAYQDEDGVAWILAEGKSFAKNKELDKWELKDRKWGLTSSSSNKAEKIDFAFVDDKGRTFIFSGKEYTRFTDGLGKVDEGYPKAIEGNWEMEDVENPIPTTDLDSLGGWILGPDGKRYIFQNDQYSSSEDYDQKNAVNSFWGKIKNNFTDLEKVDAALSIGSRAVIIAQDQAIYYSNGLENEGLLVDEGSPLGLESLRPNLLKDLEGAVTAGFTSESGEVYLFGNGKYLQLSSDLTDEIEQGKIAEKWGINDNNLGKEGLVDAALDGLDGRMYLFSGGHYYRYSGANYEKVDAGFPKSIKENWGGLDKVNSGTILDGKTYLFGEKDGKDTYIRFSTNDYTTPDTDYTVDNAENWWNLPFSLVSLKFTTPDAVFQDFDGNTHLFLNDKFVTFDRLQRWWSEPKELKTKWDSLPFTKIDAALIGKDGKTYLFSGNQFVRYSDKFYNKLDADFPKNTKEFFGKVDSQIAEKNQIDAAVSVVSRTKDETDKLVETQHTYLFAGHQFYRYSGSNLEFVDEGYPKLISEDLAKEPRFKGLKMDFSQPIDAVMSDQRNVYVFQGEQLNIYSDELYKVYPNALMKTPEVVLQEEGTMYYLSNKIWQSVSHLERKTITEEVKMPRLVDKFPKDYENGLKSILQGVDGVTYLFQEKDCYNTVLEKSYPIHDAWGKTRDNVISQNGFDAGFMGLDDKVYLFAGSQFVAYSIKEVNSVKTIATIADEKLASISEKWGGLDNVYLAYIKEGKTYLVEAPDEDGNFRYNCYSTKDYQKPDEGFPQTADFSFWQIPDNFVKNGFAQVTAVHVEEDNFYLLNGNTFIQYNMTLDKWTAPMPAERVWAGIPIGKKNDENKTDFSHLKTLFSGPNGELYFFSENAFSVFTANKFNDPQPIKSRWGIIYESFIGEGKSIDASFVSAEEQTYLFVGLNYVRYSTADYNFVDDGYPKPILENLKKEKGFENLTDALEKAIKEANGIKAITANGRNLMVFVGKDVHLISSNSSAQQGIDFLGKIRNNLQTNNQVDTAYVNAKGNLLLFSGDQFYRYSSKKLDFVDEGYPKLLKENFTKEENIDLPAGFEKGIDTAAKTKNGEVILTKGDQFVKKSPEGANTTGNISNILGKVANSFTKDGENMVSIDAAFIAPDGYFYVFKGKQYVRYENSKDEFVEAGYPQLIKDNWGDMPLDFEDEIDGGFVLDGRTYLTKGNQYIRYSNHAFNRMDSIYPQFFKDRWGNWNDLHLGDLKITTEFKALLKKSGGKKADLLDFFAADGTDRNDSFELLSEIFGWLKEDIQWVKRKNGFLAESGRFEVMMSLELVLRMEQILDLSKRLNSKPSYIFENIWQKLYAAPVIDKPRDFAAVTEVAETLAGILASKKDKNAWKELQLQIHDYLNDLKRDAMVPFVIANDADVDNTRDLLGKLLIDVEMGVEAKTSRIKEAIAAVQLYLHRYFVQVEEVKTINELGDDVIKAELKEKWRWMKNYRVWEANRKVFLYPENYLRPELRDVRTPAFDDMINELLQGEMNEDTISQIYKKYLDEYTEVSRLTIAGGYVYDDPESPNDNQLILFGRTKTDPRRFYYRNATFFGKDDSVIWNPWLEIKINIEADRVYPVYAFGRIFVFWAKVDVEILDAESGAVQLKTSDDNVTAKGSDSNTQSIVSIFFSFYNLNKEWTPPQKLDTRIVEGNGITIKDGVELSVENTPKIEGNDYENIAIKCHYQATYSYWSWESIDKNAYNFFWRFRLVKREITHDRYVKYQLTPELYTIEDRSGAHDFDNSGLGIFQQLFEEKMSEKRVVRLNNAATSEENQWISFDHKGGSFLVRPLKDKKGTADNPKKIPRENKLLIDWQRIDAAFHCDAGNYFFSGDKFIAPGENEGNQKNIKDHWGKLRTNIAKNGEVECAYLQNGIAHLFSGNQLYKFSVGNYGLIADSVEEITGKTPSAAFFNSKSQKLYKFYTDQSFSINGVVSNQKIQTLWGKGQEKNIGGKHVFSFSFQQAAYLVVDDEYYKWNTWDYSKPAEGYPKANTMQNILGDLGVQTTNTGRIFRGYFHPTTGLGAFFSHGIQTHTKWEIVEEEGGKRLVNRGERQKLDYTACFKFGEAELQFGETGIRIGQKVLKLPAPISGILQDVSGYYIFSNDKYQRLNSVTGESTSQFIKRIIAINWSEAPMSSDWGKSEKVNISSSLWTHQSVISYEKISSTIGIEGKVDSAWYDEQTDQTFLVYKDEYIRYSGSNYGFFDDDYPKPLAGNQEGLPTWSKVDAAFKGADGKTYFFNTARKIWVNSDDVTKTNQQTSNWGKINPVEFVRVDAAFCLDDKIYLFNDNNLVRHTIQSNGDIEIYADTGFPKPINKRITAALVMDDKVYLFSGNDFKVYQKSDDFDNLNIDGFSSTTHGLENIHSNFLPRFDAALNDRSKKEIHLYRGSQMITYPDTDTRNRIIESSDSDTSYIVTRLTSGTGNVLNTVLFAGGIDDFLDTETQSIDESPAFSFSTSQPNIIKVRTGMEERIDLPVSSHLDFSSANGMYYWEMFYHAPLLIAQTYNNLQNFEAAKQWYEYVFDPTQNGEYWKFIPFLNVDLAALADGIEESIMQLEKLKANGIAGIKTKFGIGETPSGIILQLRNIAKQIIDDNGKTDSVESSYFKLFTTEKIKPIRDLINDLTGGNAKQQVILNQEKKQLIELCFMLDNLESRIAMTKTYQAEIEAYLRDPFDPHAIAMLRKLAYRKSAVMRYVDNLLDWGDMLFRQYTIESINEARMHYILAYDLLGHKPENVGRLLLPPTNYYSNLDNTTIGSYDFNLSTADSNSSSYFYVPENDVFLDYWTRVEDRLYKIRESLNILGLKQALPLFQPPIDPMALVNAAASGGGFGAGMAGSMIDIPHYRFSFILEQAKQLAEKLNQFGNDLLSNLEKKDGEELSMMQSRQEGEILDMNIKVNEAQIEEAKYNLLSMKENLVEAEARKQHYDNLLDEGLTTLEGAQIGLMITTNVLYAASGVLKIGAAVAYSFPKLDVGPFKFGIQVGGDMVANGLDKISEAIQGVAQVTSTTGEIIGIYAGHERMKEDWKLQQKTAESNIRQFEHQIKASELQILMAQYQMDILEKQISHNQKVSDFYRDKYTNKQLYSWMISQLSGIYFQTYKRAFDMAKAAEKAFQFERGIKESEANFIGGGYWDSQRKGLLAGDKLGADLQKMEVEFIKTDARSFEINKMISLFELDAMALVNLKQNRICEFALTEALYDYDFQGHYRRQIKSITISFDTGTDDIIAVNATLTQLSHKTIMEPDIKAVKYLLNPKGDMPTSIRGNWRSSQQIALSRGYEDSGLYELRFEDERYLPFEGTGAISNWRLELNGRRDKLDLNSITDVIITVNYTADQGGELFGNEVKSTLKPYLTAQSISIPSEQEEAWSKFMSEDTNDLAISVWPEMFPNIRGNRIEGILCKYELFEPGEVGLMLKEQDGKELVDGKLLETSGLKIPKEGTEWTFTLKGEKENVKNIELIFTYSANLN